MNGLKNQLLGAQIATAPRVRLAKVVLCFLIAVPAEAMPLLIGSFPKEL
jgi:hypothetical protein